MAISQLDFDFVRNLIRQRAAIVLEDSKSYLVENRLGVLARNEGYANVEQLIETIRKPSAGSLQQKVVEAMTTNETYFFRDFAPFEMVRLELLPKLIQARASTKRLTIWSAASSTGQEAYSLAILIREHFPELLNWNLTILGTDISSFVLERAQKGRYSQVEVNRGLPAKLLMRYFSKDGSDWVLRPDIRHMVRFEMLNLNESWSQIPQMDLVLIRNVLIYFDTPTKQSILAKVRRNMNPDGYMLLGTAESTVLLDDQFERVDIGTSYCFQMKSNNSSPKNRLGKLVMTTS